MKKKKKNKVNILSDSEYKQYIFNITGEDVDELLKTKVDKD